MPARETLTEASQSAAAAPPPSPPPRLPLPLPARLTQLIQGTHDPCVDAARLLLTVADRQIDSPTIWNIVSGGRALEQVYRAAVLALRLDLDGTDDHVHQATVALNLLRAREGSSFRASDDREARLVLARAKDEVECSKALMARVRANMSDEANARINAYLQERFQESLDLLGVHSNALNEVKLHYAFAPAAPTKSHMG